MPVGDLRRKVLVPRRIAAGFGQLMAIKHYACHRAAKGLVCLLPCEFQCLTDRKPISLREKGQSRADKLALAPLAVYLTAKRALRGLT